MTLQPTEKTSLLETSLSHIHPRGWIQAFLRHQADGLTGHLEAAGFPFDDPATCWKAPEGLKHYEENWCPYEQRGYWIDGMIRVGLLLGDEALFRKGADICDAVLDGADEDGYLGPPILRNEGSFPGYARWNHAVFFRALTAYACANRRNDIADKLARHYRSETCAHDSGRDVCNIESMIWAYQKTGDARLLQLAEAAWRGFEKDTGEFPEISTIRDCACVGCHGVTYNEIGKLPAILGATIGSPELTELSERAFALLERDHMLVDGVHSSSERLAGNDPLASHETCDVADYVWSLGYLLMATGKAHYGDLIERAIFNAAPGCVRYDFKALQYFSCPNQIVCDRSSNHNDFRKGDTWMSFRPNPGTECCPANVNRMLPSFVSRMWLRSSNGDLSAALYGPSVYEGPAGAEGQSIRIIEETDYPFEERIRFLIETDKPVSFGLRLRIPAWSTNPALSINGQETPLRRDRKGFAEIKRRWSNGDELTLDLPMHFKLSHWKGGGIALERGPLVYSLAIEEEWEVDPTDKKSTPDFPGWNLYPASPWNYALDFDKQAPLEDQISFSRHSISEHPWTPESARQVLEVPARRVHGWAEQRSSTITRKFYKGGVALSDEIEGEQLEGDFRLTPPLPKPSELAPNLGQRETIRLIPYGATHLRITVFPDARP